MVVQTEQLIKTAWPTHVHIHMYKHEDINIVTHEYAHIIMVAISC